MADTSIALATYVDASGASTPAATRRSSYEGSTEDDKRPLTIGAGAEAFDAFPEGGTQAWLQVICGFCLFFTTLGGIYCWGVFQEALFHETGLPSSTLSFIGSTQATLEAVLAIPISRLVAAYGPRKVALAGTVCAGLGPIIAGSLTHSVAGLVIFEGLMFGTGQALCFHCAATLPAQYFKRKRNLATGLVFAGAGLGGSVFSIIASQLIERVGISWAFRIIGCLFFAINLPCSWMLKSRAARVPWSTKKTEDGEKVKAIDWSFFKDLRFTLLFAGTGIALFPLFVPPFFLPLFGTSIGLSSSTSSLLLAGFNLASAFGRVLFGLGADAYLGSTNSLVLCLFSVSVTTLVIWPFAGSLAPLAVFAVMNGFCAGGFFSLVPGTVSALFGTRKLPVGFGMICSAWAPGYFLGAPIAGYLLQAVGGPAQGYSAFKPAIFYSGGLSLVSALLVLGARLKETRSWRKL